MSYPLNLFFYLPALFTDLLAPRRNNNVAAHFLFDAFIHDIDNAINRRGDNRKIHSRLQGGNRS